MSVAPPSQQTTAVSGSNTPSSNNTAGGSNLNTFSRASNKQQSQNTGNAFMTLTKESEDSILKYIASSQQLLQSSYSLRSQLEDIDRAYMREQNFDEKNWKARLANKLGDPSKVQDVTVPVIMPQVETAVGYLKEVFLSGYPIFDVAADPANEQAALMVKTIVEENSNTSGWARQMLMFFRDGLKYNIHALECEWQEKNIYTLDNDATAPTGAKQKKTLWTGNVLKRMDMYNTFFDPRVHPAEIHEHGEFAGYIELYSRTRMKKLVNDLTTQLPVSVVMRALQSTPSGGYMTSGSAPFCYYQPLINPNPLMERSIQNSFDWMSWATNTSYLDTNKNPIRYANAYMVCKAYARIIPADFGLNVPDPNTPQVWKFRIINGTVVLTAERQTNVHNFIPMFFGQPIEDGLDYQTKSFASNVEDLQQIATSMWSGYMASKRRLVGDRVLFDPSRIRKEDINSNNPAAKIPVRPSAYGKPLQEAVYAFPFNDNQTDTLINTAAQVVNYADKVSGQNQAQQGSFVKGNKTLHEYNDTMQRADDRNQMMAMCTEFQVFVPMKEVIKLNILQYQKDGTILSSSTGQNVQISVGDLRKSAVHFKVSDGLTPTDKEMSADEFQTAIQVIGSSPQIAGEYNIGPMFSYMMKLRGLDLTPFEKPQIQVQYEQQMQAWQQAAGQAAQAKAPFSAPMPQPSPQLQQFMQQSGGGVQTSVTTAALDSTQGT